MLRREQAGALPVLISSPGGAAAAGMAAAGFRAPQQTIDSASSEKHQLIRRMKQMCSSQCGYMHIHIKVIAVPPPLTDSMAVELQEKVKEIKDLGRHSDSTML